MTPTPIRARRASSEVQAAILDSARTLFERKGYGATSMREIAQQAGVYEPTIYRRFESKVGLFEAAVLEPLQQVIASYLADWDSAERRQLPPSSTEDLVRSFMPPLYALMRDQRQLILAVMSAEEFNAAEISGHEGSFSAGIRRFVDKMRQHVDFEAGRRPLPDLDASRALLISFGLALGLAMLEGSLRSEGREDLGGQPLVDEMVKLVLFGVSARAPAAHGAQDSNLEYLFSRVADAERRAARAEIELEHIKRVLAQSNTNDSASVTDNDPT
jgi:AcrR family transcriptional regulator